MKINQSLLNRLAMKKAGTFTGETMEPPITTWENEPPTKTRS